MTDHGPCTIPWLTQLAAALASAVFYALSVVLLRQRAQRDQFIHIVLFQNLGPMLLISPMKRAKLSAS